jgi:molybdopterin-guanine dinucleotide biosynthesis protein
MHAVDDRCRRAAAAKWAFTTRRVPRAHAAGLDAHLDRTVAGDLVLARVETIGAHRRLQLAASRFAELYEGDLVVVACGDRYASDQFEGVAELDPAGADLLAGGGVIGRMRARNARVAAPTRLTPIGRVTGADGTVLNLASYALPSAPASRRPVVVGVVGAAMNAGKTTAVASLAHGLARAGHAVAALKATGTGAFGDVHAYADAGACFVADFTDAGMVATYRQPLERIEAGLERLLDHAAAAGCSVALVEFADGVFQHETAALLRSERTRARLDGIVFAAGDALGAAGGVAWLRNVDLEPVAVTGMVSRSPLAASEAEAATNVRVVSRDELLDPAGATALLATVRHGRDGAEAAGVAA